ncbi:hypothetical protein [Lentilactobacillus sp. Marseille-Q4993]|uniref:hypothetical protein n=1 Tax=Lentilactobacillus sp. Marseille-Q4993 TaxID=3039492 RepID=UPI0024BC41D7|nr:hypothetical protein [Lentilactobacillus sp. Marseille-Q4993]
MKKWIWIIVVIIVAGSIGGYAYARHTQNEKLYTQEIKRGNAQISDQDYKGAEKSFSDALKRKSNGTKAKTLRNQTRKFMDANELLNNKKFKDSQDKYREVTAIKKGNEQLVDRANSQIKLLDKIQANVKSYTAAYTAALEQNKNKQYADSNDTLNKLLKDKNFQQPYYTDILQKVVQLQTNNNAALSNQSQSTDTNDDNDSKDNSGSQSDSNVTSGGSTDSKSDKGSSKNNTSLTPAEKKAAKNYKGSNEYTVKPKDKQVNGKQVQKAQILTARQELKEAGVNPDAFSDQDIIEVIKGAYNKNQTIAEYAKKNLNK